MGRDSRGLRPGDKQIHCYPTDRMLSFSKQSRRKASRRASPTDIYACQKWTVVLPIRRVLTGGDLLRGLKYVPWNLRCKRTQEVRLLTEAGTWKGKWDRVPKTPSWLF